MFMPRAFLLLNVETGSEDFVLNQLKKMDFVEEAYVSYGGYDLIIKVKAINMKDQPPIREQEPPQMTELKDVQVYYASMISDRKRQIFKLAKCYPELEKDIKYEVTEVDSIYYDLKKDLRENIDNEKVIEAIIQGYRIKLDILEDMLYQLQDSEKRNNPCVSL